MQTNTIRRDNIKILAAEHARSLNNYLDDTLIQKTINDLERAETSEQAFNALCLMATAINFRTPDPRSNDLRDEFAQFLSLLELNRAGFGHLWVQRAEQGNVMQIM